MERIDSIDTSKQDRPNWYRMLVAILVGFAVVQWTVGPLLGVIRPDAAEFEVYLAVKGITLAWMALVILRSTNWAAVGLRRPVRLASALYGTPLLLLGAGGLAGGIAPTMGPSTFLAYGIITAIGVLGEEILFRGVMWEAVAARGHFFTAITTAVGFGMIHALGFGGPVPNSVVASMVVFAAGTGIVLAAVRIAACTLWTAIGVHWVFNMMSFAASGGVAATFPAGMEMQILGAGVVMGLLGLVGVALASRRSGSRGAPSDAHDGAHDGAPSGAPGGSPGGPSGTEMPVGAVGGA